MINRIEEITQKIYNEGIAKAENDANSILNEAHKKADVILAEARAESKAIILQAQKDATELKKMGHSELQLAAQQFTSKLKQEICSLVCTSQAKDVIDESFKDVAFIQNMILILLTNWSNNNTQEMNVILPKEQEKEFFEFITSKTKEILDSGVEIHFDSKQENGFRIEPKDGSYTINFTDKDFEIYFTRYFKTQTKELLFGTSVDL